MKERNKQQQQQQQKDKQTNKPVNTCNRHYIKDSYQNTCYLQTQTKQHNITINYLNRWQSFIRLPYLYFEFLFSIPLSRGTPNRNVLIEGKGGSSCYLVETQLPIT